MSDRRREPIDKLERVPIDKLERVRIEKLERTRLAKLERIAPEFKRTTIDGAPADAPGGDTDADDSPDSSRMGDS